MEVKLKKELCILEDKFESIFCPIENPNDAGSFGFHPGDDDLEYVKQYEDKECVWTYIIPNIHEIKIVSGMEPVENAVNYVLTRKPCPSDLKIMVYEHDIWGRARLCIAGLSSKYCFEVTQAIDDCYWMSDLAACVLHLLNTECKDAYDPLVLCKKIREKTLEEDYKRYKLKPGPSDTMPDFIMEIPF